MRVLWYAKLLKETETKETIVFFVTFLLLVAFQSGGTRAPWAPLATPMVVSKFRDRCGPVWDTGRQTSIPGRLATLP